jgi:hypothetical protein
MNASTSLTRGQRIAILVGQRGLNNGDGGGGTFVASVTGVGALSTSTPLFVAGGAGGPGGEYDTYDEGTNNNINGVMSTTGADGKGDNVGAGGGIGPNGGKAPPDYWVSAADGGAGFAGNGGFNAWPFGSINNVPKSFKNGGKGGTNGDGIVGKGGFGGGAAYGPYGNRVGGGGGGYGGGGSGATNGDGAGGGGGGSYDITGVYSGSATNSGQGYVTVTKM